MKNLFWVLMIGFLLTGTGCAPALIGAGAAGAYQVGTDERSVGKMWSDATISSRVKTALMEDAGVQSMKIDVDTLERVVTLTGMVASKQEADRAEAVVRKVSGVKSVNNFLQIGTKSIGESMDDTVLGTKIKSRLLGAPDILSLNIDVDVNKGVVVLSGIVETGKERDTIVRIARETEGAVKVVDNIKVKKP